MSRSNLTCGVLCFLVGWPLVLYALSLPGELLGVGASPLAFPLFVIAAPLALVGTLTMLYVLIVRLLVR